MVLLICRGQRGLETSGWSALQDADVDAILDLFAKIGEENHLGEDVPADQWLRQKGASERMVSIADACIANDFGCSIDQLGLRETILENQKWDVGSCSQLCLMKLHTNAR